LRWNALPTDHNYYIGAQPAWPNALATLFDLARRGVLRIEESPERKWYRPRDFNIVLSEQAVGLRPHELGLLELLFATGTGPAASVSPSTELRTRISEVGRRLTGLWELFAEPLKT